MEAPRLLAALRARWWLVGAITLVAVAAAVAVSRSQTDRYQTSAVMLFGPASFANSPLAAGGTGSSNATSPEQQATDLALASLDTVAASVKQRLPGPMTVDELKGAVSVQLKGNSNLVAVTATWGTPSEAAVVANAFAEVIVAFRRQTAQAEVQQSIDAINNTIGAQQAALAANSRRSPAATRNEIRSLRGQVSQLETLKALQTGNVQIVERATPPAAPSSPALARNAIIAAFLGLILGSFVVLLLAQFDDRIRDESELTALMSAPVLARIPKVARSKRLGRPSPAQQDRPFVEAFEFLRLNLQLTGLQQGPLVVAVTSPAAGDGKTMVVAALAQTLALSGADVVAVDFDPSNPTLHVYFDLPRDSAAGVLVALLETDSPNDLAQATGYPNLRVLATGQHPPPPPGSIAHERLQHMLARLRDNADYVLIDTSPLLVGADASAVAAAADGVILVIDLKRIRRRDLLAAKRQLAMVRTTILGIVVNRARGDLPPHYSRERAAATIGDTSRTFTG